MRHQAPRDGGDDSSHDVILVGELIDLLDPEEPVVREECVEAAKARLADGEQPSAEVLARHLL